MPMYHFPLSSFTSPSIHTVTKIPVDTIDKRGELGWQQGVLMERQCMVAVESRELWWQCCIDGTLTSISSKFWTRWGHARAKGSRGRKTRERNREWRRCGYPDWSNQVLWCMHQLKSIEGIHPQKRAWCFQIMWKQRVQDQLSRNVAKEYQLKEKKKSHRRGGIFFGFGF